MVKPTQTFLASLRGEQHLSNLRLSFTTKGSPISVRLRAILPTSVMLDIIDMAPWGMTGATHTCCEIYEQNQTAGGEMIGVVGR